MSKNNWFSVFDQMEESVAVQIFLEQHKDLLTAEREKTELEPEKEALKATRQLKSLPGKMAFHDEILRANAGGNIVLQFDNNDQMPHNISVTTPAAKDVVGKAADDMSVLPDAYEKNFIPDIPEVLFATALVQVGKSCQLNLLPQRLKVIILLSALSQGIGK